MQAITQSMLSMFLKCFHQFVRRYLRGEIIPLGIVARRGSAPRKAAQLNHEQKLHAPEYLPLGDLQDAARGHYLQQIKEEGAFIPKDQVSEKERLLAGGMAAAVQLTRLYRQPLAPAIQPLLVEKKFILDTGLTLPLQGTIVVLTAEHWLPDLITADISNGEADPPCNSPVMPVWWLTVPARGRHGSDWKSWRTTKKRNAESAHHQGTGGLGQLVAKGWFVV